MNGRHPNICDRTVRVFGSVKMNLSQSRHMRQLSLLCARAQLVASTICSSSRSNTQCLSFLKQRCLWFEPKVAQVVTSLCYRITTQSRGLFSVSFQNQTSQLAVHRQIKTQSPAKTQTVIRVLLSLHLISIHCI